MADVREIVEGFMRAYYAGDVASAREYLCDDLAFTGPAAAFTSADDYVSTSVHVTSMIDGYQIRRIFADADDVSVFSVLRPKGFAQPIAVADWYHLEGNRIASIQTIFDTGPFASAPTQPAEASIVDPVCHMHVAMTAQPVTRTWANGTYSFCSEGCARAFESNPSRYVLVDEPQRRVLNGDRATIDGYPARKADSQ